MIGGIEAGGTKFVCAVANQELEIVERISIPTTTPAETLAEVFTFFDRFPLAALGVGSFGPIGVQKGQENYGHILATPKPGWTNFDFLGALKRRYDIPIAWTTDVNAAAFGELTQGAASGNQSCIYLTVGTGIGGGIVVDQQVFEGVSHPEMGHIYVKRHPKDTYEGTCPYHQDCLEGLASGPSLEARTGIRGENLPENHPVWELQTYYLAQALVAYTLIINPEKIVLGGGVMNQPHLLPKIHQQFVELMNGYVTIEKVEEYIVKWGMPDESGLIGSLLLAKQKLPSC